MSWGSVTCMLVARDCHASGRTFVCFPTQECDKSFFFFLAGGGALVPVFDPVTRSLQLMGLRGNEYVYSEDLRKLSTASITDSTLGEGVIVPSPSPILLPRFSACLADFPDPRLTSFLIQGLSQGFRVGASGRLRVASTARNHPSCLTAISATKLRAGCILGPLPSYPEVPLAWYQKAILGTHGG